jgi:hypothetical protein
MERRRDKAKIREGFVDFKSYPSSDATPNKEGLQCAA